MFEKSNMLFSENKSNKIYITALQREVKKLNESIKNRSRIPTRFYASIS